MNGIIPMWLTMPVDRAALKLSNNWQRFSFLETSKGIGQLFRRTLIGAIGPKAEPFSAKELVPLAKRPPECHRRDANGCDRDGRAPPEQNNPIEQRNRLLNQAGGEQQKLDEDFLVALDHGMPPAGGIGTDR